MKMVMIYTKSIHKHTFTLIVHAQIIAFFKNGIVQYTYIHFTCVMTLRFVIRVGCNRGWYKVNLTLTRYIQDFSYSCRVFGWSMSLFKIEKCTCTPLTLWNAAFLINIQIFLTIKFFSGLFATVRKCTHKESGVEYAAKYSSR